MTAPRDRDAGQQCVGFRTQCRLYRLMQGPYEYCIAVCTASHPVVRSAGRQMCDTTVSGANGLSNHTANPEAELQYVRLSRQTILQLNAHHGHLRHFHIS